MLGAQQLDNTAVFNRNTSINYKVEGDKQNSLFRFETNL